MVRILKDFYADKDLGKILGFKGGTMAYLFYDLPRESVDLDFDLLDKNNESLVFDRVKMIIEKHGKIVESVVKKNTIFFLLDYGFEERKLKIEITRVKTETNFVVMNYLGISMLVMNREAMVAGKLLALATRTKMANRDVFDIWYFLKNGWEIDDEVIKSKSGLGTKEIIEMAISRIEKIKTNQILFGLGDLIDNSTKDFVRQHLKEDVLLELRMRL
ncbi:MAG: nucleotidyl transferase AbiEii/AbiGii toxin family protein [Candidatus Shapirobacteria bacterium]